MSAAINQSFLSCPRVNSPPESITVEKDDKVVNINNQLLYFAAAVQEQFRLEPEERLRLTRFYEFESQDLNDKNALKSVFNLVKGYMACSEWNYLHALLSRRGEFVLETHHNFDLLRQDAAKKADNLAKFIMNYLITLNAICTGQGVRKISEYQWTHHRMHELTLEQVLDRAPSGNGTDFGPMELREINSIFTKVASDYRELAITLYNLNSKQMPEGLAKECAQMVKYNLTYLPVLQEEERMDLKKYSGDVKHYYAKLVALRQAHALLLDLVKRVQKEIIRA